MKLVFVYNADSGIFNTFTDIAHKVFSPDTYECNLCNLTHSYFQARDEWVNFLKNVDAEITFLHRDEYIKQHANSETNFPAIFVEDGDELKLWVDKNVINELSSVDDLMEMIRAAVLKSQAGISDADGVDDFLNLPT